MWQFFVAYLIGGGLMLLVGLGALVVLVVLLEVFDGKDVK